nr:hypothetical protein [Tanacetum cinerariifolium]
MDRHNEIFVISSNTKKVFANMKREGKDFSGKVTPLFKTMMVQAPKDMGEGDQEDASKQGRRIDNIDQVIKITLVDESRGRMNEEDMFGVNDLDGNEVVVDVSASKKVEQSVKVVEKEVSIADPVTAGIEVTTAATTPQISKDELTLAQTLIEIKAAKPKVITTAATTFTAANKRPNEKGIVMQEPLKHLHQNQ